MANTDRHCYIYGCDGLTRVLSPLWTRDWRYDHKVDNETNLRLRKAAGDASRNWWLAASRNTPAGESFAASQVVRDDPKRGLRIGQTGVWLVAMPAPKPLTRRERQEAGSRRRSDELRAIQKGGQAQRDRAMALERVARKEQMSVYPTWDGVAGPVNDPDTFWDTYAEMGETLGLGPTHQQLTARAGRLRQQGHEAAAVEFETWSQRVRLEADLLRRDDEESADDDYDDYEHEWRSGPEAEHSVVLLDGRRGALVVEDGAALIRQAFRETGARCSAGFGMSFGPWTWSGREEAADRDYSLEAVAMIGWIDIICRRGGGKRPREVQTAIDAVQTLGGEHQTLLGRLVALVPLAEGGRADDDGAEAGPAVSASASTDGDTA
jgi:hypothetical protein